MSYRSRLSDAERLRRFLRRRERSQEIELANLRRQNAALRAQLGLPRVRTASASGVVNFSRAK